MIYSIIAIILVVASIILATFNIAKGRLLPILIYFSALFVIYSTTMVGYSVVGTDISRELLMSNLALNGWDLSIFDPSNTSVVVGWFVPVLSKITTIEPVWVYKAYLPMIFALTPFILYFIFKKQFGELKAFYASMFFIIMPVFNLEVATIAKSMVAETFMALTLWVMFNAEWKQVYKFLLMVVLVVLTLWSHYTIGILLCIYLGGIAVYLGIVGFRVVRTKQELDEWAWKVGFPVLVVLIASIFFNLYYSNVAQGLIWDSSTGILNYDFGQSLNVIQSSVDNADNYIKSTVKAYSLVKSAFGLDLLNYSWSGIAFRVVQLITQTLIVVGFAWMLWKRNYPQNGILTYRIKPEYIAGCLVAFGLLGLCVVVPAFATLINATRQYHVTLFFLAPMLVLAFDGIEKFWKWGIK